MAVMDRPIVVASATVAARTYNRVATDGGEKPETCDRCPTLLKHVHDEHRATVVTTDGEELCPDCANARSGEEIGFITNDDSDESDDEPHVRDDSDMSEPTRSEKPDMGGGESTGVVDL